MKIGRVILKTPLRELLCSQSARSLITSIYPGKMSKLPLEISLDETNWCINDTNIHWSERPDEMPNSNDVYNHCYETAEYKLATYLIKNRYIKARIIGDGDGDLILDISSVNGPKMKEVYYWTLDHNDILSYGLFSLNLRTGVVYFDNNKTNLRPGSKYSEILKKLILSSDNFLTYEEIDKIRTTKSKNIEYSYRVKDYAINAAKYLKNKLKMRHGNGKMLHIYDGKGFKLDKFQR